MVFIYFIPNCLHQTPWVYSIRKMWNFMISKRMWWHWKKCAIFFLNIETFRNYQTFCQIIGQFRNLISLIWQVLKLVINSYLLYWRNIDNWNKYSKYSGNITWQEFLSHLRGHRNRKYNFVMWSQYW